MKIVIGLAVILALAAVAKWAFTPGCHLPRHRVRHTRLRLHLRLHPGRGYATCAELWLRWGRLGRVPPVGPDPAVAAGLAAGQPAAGAFGAAGPGAIPAPAGRAAGRARAGDGPPADLQDGAAGVGHLALPGPGDLHHHQGRRIHPHLRRPVPARPGARVQPAIHRQHPLHLRLVAGPGVRTAGGGDPPGGRLRPGRLAERAWRTARSGRPRRRTTCAPTSTPPPSPAPTCAWWPGGCWAPTPTPRRRSCVPPGPPTGR